MLANRPLVSVVIPAYNVAGVLPDTIASVQAQTWTDWELLIIDDGSQDDTAAVAAQAQAQDSRITLIRQSNQGVSVARNLGVERSQGQFIAFLDADDVWLPSKLTTHLEHLLAQPQLGVSFAQVEFMTQAGIPTGKISRSRLTGITPDYLLSENPTTTTSNWVIRRAVWTEVGGFCATMSYSEDLEWLFRALCSQHWQVEGIGQVLTRYRTSSGGLSADLYRMEAGWHAFTAQAQTYAPTLVAQYFAQAEAVHLRYLARRALRLGLPASVGLDFIHRALRSQRQLLWREPRRTLLTLLALWGQHCLQKLGIGQPNAPHSPLAALK